MHRPWDKGIQAVAFDGKRWFVGRYAYPKEFLDHEKYPPEFYNHERRSSEGGAGRPLDFIHGYESDSADFPEKIPLVDRQKVAELHEKHIIPLWEESDRKFGQQFERRTHTSFESLNEGVDINEHVPPEALAELRKAHAKGDPIGIRYDPESGQWQKMDIHTWERLKKPVHENASPPPRAAMKPAETVEKNAAKLEGKGGKIAIIGGGVALVAVLGYWVWKVAHQKKERQQENAAAAVKS